MENRQEQPPPAAGEDYLRSVCEQYARRDGDEIVIELPEAHERALGRFLIQAVFGFLLGQKAPKGALAVVSQKGEEARSVTTS